MVESVEIVRFPFRLIQRVSNLVHIISDSRGLLCDSEMGVHRIFQGLVLPFKGLLRIERKREQARLLLGIAEGVMSLLHFPQKSTVLGVAKALEIKGDPCEREALPFRRLDLRQE